MSNLLFVLSVSDELRLALHRGPAVSGFEFRFCTLRIRETAVPEPCGREWDRPSVRSTRMGFRSANSLQSSSPDSWAAKKSYPHFRSFVSSFDRTTSSCNELCNERLLNFDGKWFKGKQFFQEIISALPNVVETDDEHENGESIFGRPTHTNRERKKTFDASRHSHRNTHYLNPLARPRAHSLSPPITPLPQNAH